MKKTLLLFTVFLYSFFGVSAENVLLLSNPKTGEVNEFKKGSFLVFELISDKSIREGVVKDIQDSSISFEDILFEGQVSLSQIKILAGTSKAKIVAGKIANGVGNAMVIAGMTVFDCGLNFMFYNDYYYWPLGGSIWVAGAFIAGMGHLIDWATYPVEHRVRVRNYRNWEASIVKSEQVVSEKENQVIKDSTNTINPEKSIPAIDKENKKEKRRKKVSNDDDVYGG